MQIGTRYLDPIAVEVTGTVTVAGRKVSDAVRDYIVAYGLRQTIDDAGADPSKAAGGSRARLDALLSGIVPAGGGKRLSPLERAIRTVVEGLLRKAGYKAADAVKAATDPEGAFRELIRAQAASKLGMAASSVPAEVVERNFTRLYPEAVEKKALAIVTATADAADFSVE